MTLEDFDYYEAPEGYEEAPPPPDGYFVEAQKRIRNLFDGDRSGVYYLRQLQLMFEKDYFHWVTNNALVGLIKIGYLKEQRVSGVSGRTTRYFMHRSHRYPMRQINNIESLINEYSQDHITKSCGRIAEDLFLKALSLNGFLPIGMKVKEFDGKKWEETGHDLDFVFSKDGMNYGCEIKNTLGYIDKDELDVKIRMCGFFGIKPLFILRNSPKSYINQVRIKGGYTMIYETQIYDVSQTELVDKIKNQLGLPVVCSKGIPSGIINRFQTWHDRTKAVV